MSVHEIVQSFKNLSADQRQNSFGRVVVVTAEEMIDIVRDKGPVEAALQVDVVTTGTFAPMCSSGAFINFGHSIPGIKASASGSTMFRLTPAWRPVDCYLGHGACRG